MNEVKIQWLGHSCFCMEYREYSIVTDPYEDGYVPGLAPLCLSAGAVYCSHGHGDHSAAAIFPCRNLPCRTTTTAARAAG